jgi:hypothetical protein
MTITSKRIPTTLEVYRLLLSTHRESISVFESCTDIVEHGSSYVLTVWGFKNSEAPLFGASTSYFTYWGEKDEESVEHRYWLYELTSEED